MNKTANKRSDCPIACALDVFGDKWSLLIIRNLMFYDLHTYGEFLKLPERIATNILADRLLMLEDQDLISRQEHPGSAAKIFYKLTRKGIDLAPILIEISIWGDKYFDISPMAKQQLKEAKKDKTGYIKSLSERLRKVVP